ncbi:uncharacterized protein BDW47DRAFT_109058 [Aspergillus candidus]|uniref:Secreted protein n=1 Tax=Aspergillus candidus TaxID=41067 RepID=A0A2I2F6J6_ASPCN|nr:hypothetical protein BDW47DRAFT_109058 [Aspergillus candidus]PLB36269.1 hypothetical protein BDW47DRAFT_109058 [Aspergillus candidus]
MGPRLLRMGFIAVLPLLIGGRWETAPSALFFGDPLFPSLLICLPPYHSPPSSGIPQTGDLIWAPASVVRENQFISHKAEPRRTSGARAELSSKEGARLMRFPSTDDGRDHGRPAQAH